MSYRKSRYLYTVFVSAESVYTRFLNKRGISRFPAISVEISKLEISVLRMRYFPGYKGQPESTTSRLMRMLNKIYPPILSVIYNGDFQISRKISGFQRRFPDFTKDFRISTEISRFHERFQDFPGDFRQGVLYGDAQFDNLCTLGSGVFRGTCACVNVIKVKLHSIRKQVVVV